MEVCEVCNGPVAPGIACCFPDTVEYDEIHQLQAYIKSTEIELKNANLKLQELVTKHIFDDLSEATVINQEAEDYLAQFMGFTTKKVDSVGAYWLKDEGDSTGFRIHPGFTTILMALIDALQMFTVKEYGFVLNIADKELYGSLKTPNQPNPIAFVRMPVTKDSLEKMLLILIYRALEHYTHSQGKPVTILSK